MVHSYYRTDSWDRRKTHIFTIQGPFNASRNVDIHKARYEECYEARISHVLSY